MSHVPEQYRFSPTPHVPNSPLPVLVYRSVLPAYPTAGSTTEAIEKNLWLRGGVFKTFRTHHFHSVTHECYAVFRGSSTLLLGRGPLESEGGVEVRLAQGDIIVLPVSTSARTSPGDESNMAQAGVSHCSLDSDGDYEYVGLYPKVRLLRNTSPRTPRDDVMRRAVLTGTITGARRARPKPRRRPATPARSLYQTLIPSTVAAALWFRSGATLLLALSRKRCMNRYAAFHSADCCLVECSWLLTRLTFGNKMRRGIFPQIMRDLIRSLCAADSYLSDQDREITLWWSHVLIALPNTRLPSAISHQGDLQPNPP